MIAEMATLILVIFAAVVGVVAVIAARRNLARKQAEIQRNSLPAEIARLEKELDQGDQASHREAL